VKKKEKKKWRIRNDKRGKKGKNEKKNRTPKNQKPAGERELAGSPPSLRVG